MTRQIRCNCQQHRVCWHGASWREHGERASLLNGRGREITHEDPRLAGIKGPYQSVDISVKSSRDKRG